MFSLQPSDELVFGASNPPCEDMMILKDEAALTQTNFINFGTGSDEGRRVMKSGLTDHERERNSNSNSNIRRDIERKRRLEMSNLHLTLTSLLPTKLNKGKSGVCDQMQEAANYIKTMQNKIQELRIRRNEVNKLSENKVVTTIDVLPDGMMEILMKTSHVYFEISRVFQVLAEMELDVVNCVSTSTNPAGFLHKFHIQAKEMRSLDLSLLQDKLSNAMK